MSVATEWYGQTALYYSLATAKIQHMTCGYRMRAGLITAQGVLSPFELQAQPFSLTYPAVGACFDLLHHGYMLLRLMHQTCSHYN